MKVISMGTTRYYEYACRCGEIGKYSTHSSDWFFRMVGIGQKNPPTCIRCGNGICDRCKKGRFCENCATDVSPIIKGVLTLFNVITVLGGIFVLLALIFLVNIGNFGDTGIDPKIPVIIIVIYIVARMAQFILKESIKKKID
jgi:hypothetical protein